jgi:DNA-binding transcriptional MerR regulator
MNEYRVEELAAAAGLTVELVRSYQSKGLLPAPRHAGRVAWYGTRHLERLQQIKELKARGYSLKAMAELLGERLAATGGGGPLPIEDDDRELFTLREVAQHSGVPPAMLRSLEASGVLRPRRPAVDGNEARYTRLDVLAVRMLLALLGSGLPMEEFMEVARVQLNAAEHVAGGAARLFLRYVRDPLVAQGLDEAKEAEQLRAGFRLMLEATTTLLSYNFYRMVLNAVEAELDEPLTP